MVLWLIFGCWLIGALVVAAYLISNKPDRKVSKEDEGDIIFISLCWPIVLLFNAIFRLLQLLVKGYLSLAMWLARYI